MQCQTVAGILPEYSSYKLFEKSFLFFFLGALRKREAEKARIWRLGG
jgi:hypothetical protein